MYTDLTVVSAQVGAHVEVLEIDDLGARVAQVGDAEAAAKQDEIRAMFDFADPSSDPIAAPVELEQLDRSARVAAGLDRLVADFELDALTYYYRGLDGNEAEQLGAGVIVGNSLLTARGIPTSGEADLKTNVAQLILDRLGAGGSFTEYYALDFADDFVLMGHDGPGHIAIAEGRPTLRSLKVFHGKRGSGLSVEFKVRYGPITIVGGTQTADGRLKLVVAEGESIPGETFRIGNTNSRLRFRLPPAEFFERWCAEGPTHHVALGVGHVADEVSKVASLLGIEYAEVNG
jgi:L-arabinose isomerase